MQAGIQLLLIDDDADFQAVFRQNLGRDFLIQTQAGADEIFAHPELCREFDALVIDLLMPRIDGLALVVELRRKLDEPPPLFLLTQDNSEDLKVAAFQSRPEDFLHKSMSWEEIRLRIKNRLETRFRQHGSLRFHYGRNAVNLQGREIVLTQVEMSILSSILNSDSALIQRDLLMLQVWKGRHVVEHTLNSHIHNINKKLKEWDFLVRLDKSGVASLEKKA